MKITTSLLIGTIKIARNLTTSFSQSHNLDKTICINFASCVRVVSFFGAFFWVNQIVHFHLRSRLKYWNQILNRCHLLCVLLIFSRILLAVLTHLLVTCDSELREYRIKKYENILLTIASVCASDAVFLRCVESQKNFFLFEKVTFYPRMLKCTCVP